MAKSAVFAVLVVKSGYVKSSDGDLIFTPHIIDAQAFTDFYDAQYVAEKYGGSVDEAEIADVNTCGEMYAGEMIAERTVGHSGPWSVRQISRAARLWNDALAAAAEKDPAELSAVVRLAGINAGAECSLHEDHVLEAAKLWDEMKRAAIARRNEERQISCATCKSQIDELNESILCDECLIDEVVKTESCNE